MSPILVLVKLKRSALFDNCEENRLLIEIWIVKYSIAIFEK